MRVISLHKSAKFGCFISINNKNFKQFTAVGTFSAKFLTTPGPSGKTMDGTQKL